MDFGTHRPGEHSRILRLPEQRVIGPGNALSAEEMLFRRARRRRGSAATEEESSGGILLPDLAAGWSLTSGPQQTLSSAGVVASGPADFTNSGSVTFDSSGAAFNGTGQLLTRDASAPLNLSTGSFLVAGLVTINGGSTNDTPLPLLFSASNIADRLEVGPCVSNSHPGKCWVDSSINQAGGPLYPDDASLSLGQLLFIAFFWDDDAEIAYLQVNNGTASSEAPTNNNLIAQDEMCVGGSSIDGVFMEGTVKYLRLWQGANAGTIFANPTYMTWLYNSGAGRNDQEVAQYTG